jgi:CheY-like chemotaxis protein/anti-sigma regulatory factor (Ser/Thr protein kinase)
VLDLHLTSDNAWVNGDKQRLVQVLANLLGNAAKYTPKGGHIILQTSLTESEVAISVCDNGIGMSQELLARAFDLFTQGERTVDRSQGGLGIGLALVKKLVELHSGTAEAESEGVGKGSQFTVRLPRAHRADGHESFSEFPNPTAQDSQLQVMIVDDNTDAAQILAMYVEAIGHKALVENLPSKALVRASELSPQVCLLDIGLPEFSGYELAQRLRAIPGMANAVLIAVTGYGQPGDKEKAMSSGFDYHFVKPIDTKALLDLLFRAAANL